MKSHTFPVEFLKEPLKKFQKQFQKITNQSLNDASKSMWEFLRVILEESLEKFSKKSHEGFIKEF